MKLSEKIKQIKDKVMLGIHNKPVPISLEELKKHNKKIDEAIKQIEKNENKNKK